jgi:hypothetical protein
MREQSSENNQIIILLLHIEENGGDKVLSKEAEEKRKKRKKILQRLKRTEIVKARTFSSAVDQDKLRPGDEQERGDDELIGVFVYLLRIIKNIPGPRVSTAKKRETRKRTW